MQDVCIFCDLIVFFPEQLNAAHLFSPGTGRRSETAASRVQLKLSADQTIPDVGGAKGKAHQRHFNTDLSVVVFLSISGLEACLLLHLKPHPELLTPHGPQSWLEGLLFSTYHYAGGSVHQETAQHTSPPHDQVYIHSSEYGWARSERLVHCQPESDEEGGDGDVGASNKITPAPEASQRAAIKHTMIIILPKFL